MSSVNENDIDLKQNRQFCVPHLPATDYLRIADKAKKNILASDFVNDIPKDVFLQITVIAEMLDRATEKLNESSNN